MGGSPVTRIEDYLNLEVHNFETNQKQQLNFSPSNVLIFKLQDGSVIALRPSGTEPKIKYYFSVNQAFDPQLSWKEQESILEKRLDTLVLSTLPS